MHTSVSILLYTRSINWLEYVSGSEFRQKSMHPCANFLVVFGVAPRQDSAQPSIHTGCGATPTTHTRAKASMPASIRTAVNPVCSTRLYSRHMWNVKNSHQHPWQPHDDDFLNIEPRTFLAVHNNSYIIISNLPVALFSTRLRCTHDDGGDPGVHVRRGLRGALSLRRGPRRGHGKSSVQRGREYDTGDVGRTPTSHDIGGGSGRDAKERM